MSSLITSSTLNNLEKKILTDIAPLLKGDANISISKASELLNISPSKLSKFVRKMGFENFKEFKRLNEGLGSGFVEKNVDKSESHLSKIKLFAERLDLDMVNDITRLIGSHSNIVIYGAGPSYACAEYFCDRIQMVLNKRAVAVNDINMLEHYCSPDTLLITLSVSGLYESYENLVKVGTSETLFIFEDFVTLSELARHKVFYLTKERRMGGEAHYKRPRTLFFIFLEEVIIKLIHNMEHIKKERST